MDIVHTIDEVRLRVHEARSQNKKIGFVPTMGYLHQGHLNLVEISQRYAQYQVMSIFVNKIQFNDPGDYQSYPRDLEKDFTSASRAGVDLMFVPSDEEMYRNHLTHVDMDILTENLCGSARPGHFRGVFTVVSKLFNIVEPDVSVFGQKDIQQAISIEKMVEDLNFPVKIIIAPITREGDGLAMSSRNKHLDEKERQNAVSIYRSLKTAENLITGGEKDTAVITDKIRSVIEEGAPSQIDYISAVDYTTLHPITHLTQKCIIAVAVFFGKTRLIDNMIITMEGNRHTCIY